MQKPHYPWKVLTLACVLTMGWLVLAASAQNFVSCGLPVANPEGIAGQDLTISLTPVVVFRANTSLCTWVLFNTSTTDALRCRSTNDGMVSATAGQKVPPGAAWSMGPEGRGGVRCVRDQSATNDIVVSGTWVIP